MARRSAKLGAMIRLGQHRKLRVGRHGGSAEDGRSRRIVGSRAPVWERQRPSGPAETARSTNSFLAPPLAATASHNEDDSSQTPDNTGFARLDDEVRIEPMTTARPAKGFPMGLVDGVAGRSGACRSRWRMRGGLYQSDPSQHEQHSGHRRGHQSARHPETIRGGLKGQPIHVHAEHAGDEGRRQQQRRYDRQHR